ncbi:hypothetical protein [Gimesia panareensis]|uniref:hypothetical protein n=1 Tax=Gimesia panareensis TaxID=2527978 RepID=UPI00119EBE3E|nr:hypothetical protein [Gimesia panareensis]
MAVIELFLLGLLGYLFLDFGYTIWSVLKIDIVHFLKTVRGIADTEHYPPPENWWGLMAFSLLMICVFAPFRMFLQYLGKERKRDGEE